MLHARTSRRIGLALILAASAASLFLASRAEAQQGTLTFTMEATPAAGGQVTPKLTWATSPAATGCTASGASNWTGAKAGSGTQTLAAVTPPVTYTLKCNWPGDTSARLSWTPPTQNTDGSTLSNLAGYRIMYGASSSNLSQLVSLQSPGASTYTVDNLTAGAWFFAVKAYSTAGAESVQSNVATKTIAPPFEVTQSVGVAVPNPPTGLAVE